MLAFGQGREYAAIGAVQFRLGMYERLYDPAFERGTYSLRFDEGEGSFIAGGFDAEDGHADMVAYQAAIAK